MADVLLTPEFMNKLQAVALRTHKIFTGRMRGERRSRRRGISVEFADYRDYAEGDDLRHVDWNIFGRLDRLFLKLFMEEEDLHLYLVVDTSHSMGFGRPPKLDYAVRLAAALGYMGLRGGERVHLCTFSDRLGASTRPLRGRRSMWEMFEFLGKLQPEGRTSLNRTSKELMLRYRRKGVLVFISDLLDPEGFEPALKSIVGAKMDTCVIHLLAHEEVEPDLRGDYRLVDIETEQLVDVTASRPLLKQYRNTVALFLKDVRDFCSAKGAGYEFLTTATSVEDFVLGNLRRSGLLG